MKFKDAVLIRTKLIDIDHRLGDICYDLTNHRGSNANGNDPTYWIKTFLELSKYRKITIPQPLLIEITLALLDSYEERKEKLGVITNLESRRQNNESKATN